MMRFDKGKKNRDVSSRSVNRPPMEDIVVNAEEHKLLKKSWKYLEKRYNVLIRMPLTKSLDSDVIFVSIQGEPSNREYVKKFLKEKMKVLTPVESYDKDGDVVITLSDSESESSADSDDISIIDLTDEDTSQSEKEFPFKETHNKSVCIIETPTCSDNIQTLINRKRKKIGRRKAVKNKKVRSKSASISGDKISDSCEVTSTTSDNMVSKNAKLSDSVLIIEEPSTSSNPALDFIPLQSGSKSETQKNDHNKNIKSENSDEINDSMILTDEPEKPRRLRPIVIDGSNVAMEHGVKSRTFSAKGIKLAIDYFLKRGHEKVTAFVPKFRKHPNPNRKVPTTDAYIFEELEKQQLVVYTPSRRVDGKCFSSYDDRFIVKLAATNGGVIVSNDNFHDLMNENKEFKQVIKERLLMFCFVDDNFMVPDDPLGRNGPKLADFLSFPP